MAGKAGLVAASVIKYPPARGGYGAARVIFFKAVETRRRPGGNCGL
jgi:hypothetical protein